MPGLLALGAGGFAGPVAGVAAAAAFFISLFSDKEPLRLALELKLRGSITGSLYTPITTQIFDCYLPGRFDARDMHLADGVPLSDWNLHQYLPRYDRTLGHFGYRYDPSHLQCRVIFFGTYGEPDPAGSFIWAEETIWREGMCCVWPAPEAPQFPYPEFRHSSRWRWNADSEDHPAPVDGFLPVVLNECAELCQSTRMAQRE